MRSLQMPRRILAASLVLVSLFGLACERRDAAPSPAPAPSPSSRPDEWAACAEIGEAGFDVITVYCRHHGHPCCIDAGAFSGWNCNNADYLEWQAKTCR